MIKSLESYKANKGDIRKKRTYNFLFGVCESGSWWRDVETQLYGLTANIVKKLNEYYSRKFSKMAYENYHIAGYVIDSDDEIYDYVFDVEFYEVSHELEVLLYKHNFDINNIHIPAGARKRLVCFEKVAPKD